MAHNRRTTKLRKWLEKKRNSNLRGIGKRGTRKHEEKGMRVRSNEGVAHHYRNCLSLPVYLSACASLSLHLHLPQRAAPGQITGSSIAG